jgi:uncharacterized delta-60 repeat protein
VKTKNKLVAAMTAAVLTMVGNVASAAPGDLDAGFGTGGRVTTAIIDNANANAIMHDALGRLVAVGQSNDFLLGNSVPILARYWPDGSLDTSFGDAGTGIVAMPSPAGMGFSAAFNSVAIDSKERVIVGGYVSIDDPFGVTHRVWTVARYTSTGVLDSTFGQNGIVLNMVSTDEFASMLYSLVIDQHDRVVAAGWTEDSVGYENTIVARYNENGGLDHTFAKTGIASLSTGGRAACVAIDSTGRIVFEAEDAFDGETFVGRYLDDGTLDTSFGPFGTGIATVENTIANTLVLDSSDRPLIAGTTADAYIWTLARLDSTGQLDATFGTDGSGFVTDAIGGSDDTSGVESLKFDSAGDILSAGYDYDNDDDTTSISLVRYTPDGIVDQTFGNGGYATVSATSTNDYGVTSMTIDDTDHIAIAGWVYDGASDQFAITRFED